MLVRAIADGFYGSRRRAGDEFEVPEGTTARWFAPLGETRVTRKGGKGKKPDAPQTPEVPEGDEGGEGKGAEDLA